MYIKIYLNFFSQIENRTKYIYYVIIQLEKQVEIPASKVSTFQCCYAYVFVSCCRAVGRCEIGGRGIAMRWAQSAHLVQIGLTYPRTQRCLTYLSKFGGPSTPLPPRSNVPVFETCPNRTQSSEVQYTVKYSLDLTQCPMDLNKMVLIPRNKN